MCSSPTRGARTVATSSTRTVGGASGYRPAAGICSSPEGRTGRYTARRFVYGGYAALFDWIDLDVDTDPELVPCDAVEAINGTTMSNTDQVFADWLMLHGREIRTTATAVSDTHETDDWVGHPRTLVRIDGALAEQALVSALESVSGRREQTLTFDVPDGARFVVVQHLASADDRPGIRRAPRFITNPVFFDPR